MTLEKFDEDVLYSLSCILEDNDEYDYSARKAVEMIQNGMFDEYCPYMMRDVRRKYPKEYVNCENGHLWAGDCVTFTIPEKEFVIEHVEDVNKELIMSDGQSGCRNCWYFNYNYVKAHIIKNGSFWKLRDLE